jgi:hypothetical protein
MLEVSSVLARSSAHDDLQQLFSRCGPNFCIPKSSDDQQRHGFGSQLPSYEYQILIDRRENTSIEDVRRTLEHESCHIFVDWKEQEEHGRMFQDCATRFR